VLEQLRRNGVFLRHQGKRVGAIRGVGVAALALADYLTFHGPGLAGGAEDLFGKVEVGFQLFIADAEILQGHVLGNELLAIAFFVMAAHAQLDRVDPKMHARPVQASPAHALAGQESAQLAVGQGDVVDAVADRHRLLGNVDEQLFAHAVGQFVDDLRVAAVRVGILHWPTLQSEYLQAGLGQLLGHDRASPAKANDHRIDFLHDGRHVRPSRRGWKLPGRGRLRCALPSP
jgi:hypothetical protein